MVDTCSSLVAIYIVVCLQCHCDAFITLAPSVILFRRCYKIATIAPGGDFDVSNAHQQIRCMLMRGGADGRGAGGGRVLGLLNINPNAYGCSMAAILAM